MIRRFEPLPDSHRTIGIDRPRKVDPEFILFPNFSRIRLIGVIELLSFPFLKNAQHGLAKPDPPAGVRFLAHQVVSFGTEAHRQDIVRKPRSLAPGWSQRG